MEQVSRAGVQDGGRTWRRLCGGCGQQLVPKALAKLRELQDVHAPLCVLGTGPKSRNQVPRHVDMWRAR